MFGQTPAEKKTARNFHSKLKTHLKALEGSSPCVRVNQCPTTKRLTLAELVQIPERDIIHVLDPEVILAVSHCIEELASEIRQGELIATFQHFDNFIPLRKRYLSLARDLDAVRVWGAGEPPKRCPGIDFIVAEDPKIMKYWLVLFDGPNDHAVLVCKQLNQSARFQEKKFVGFYSFNPYLVQSIRWRFNMLSSGLNKIVNLWDKSALPNLKMRDLDLFFKSQPPSVAAVRGKKGK